MPDTRAHTERCQACKLPDPQCMCADISAVPCGIDVVVARHALEAERNSNTGRLVARALEGAKLYDYAHPDRPFEAQWLRAPASYLLFPTPSAPPVDKPARLVLVDASWSQARRMVQRIPELRDMPKLALPAPAEALPRLRVGQKPEHMSTAESAVSALRFFGENAAADHLERLLRELVRRFALPRRKGPGRWVS